MSDRAKFCSAIVVAAGRGLRAGGDLPKQFQLIAGRPLLAWTVNRLAAHPMINDVADTIGHEMKDCQTLMSYMGDGIFVGIAESNWRPRTEHVMNHVNTRLAAADIENGDGHVLDVRVSAGQAVRLAWKSGRSVLDALTQARHSADQARIAFGKLRGEFWFMDRSA